ncbi:MAG: c-type cytochrome [Chitinophagaceae bacterium]|nr:c-type cytochrome [Chitinophagaceae bacterium]
MHKKKMLAIGLLSCFIMLSIAAIKAPAQKDRNLQVLPNDISDEKLDSIMQTYNKALGVKCDFCHVKAKGFTDSLDYVSDLEPMKEEARKMMRMVIDINKKNFHYNKKDRPEYLNTVTCKTCHRGEPFPPED